jgi:catalase
VTTSEGAGIDVEVTLETTPSVLYDAVVVPGGKLAVKALGNVGQALEFLKDQYRHCKPILAIAEGTDLLQNAAVPATLLDGTPDPGLLLFPDGLDSNALARFVEAIAKHRHFERAMDPPTV